MRAYEIFLNGKRVCLAGVGKDGYISAYVNWTSETNKTDIDVVGLNASKKVYVRWDRRPIRTGDEILIKIVERKAVNKFTKIRHVDSPAKTIELRKRMARKMAKEFGWEIREKHKENRLPR